MKKQYIALLVVIIGIPAMCSTAQEFIKSPKTKKIYPSKAQYVELEADIVGITNQLSAKLCKEHKRANTAQREALNVVNDYVDSEKACFLKQASKEELFARYNKRLEEKQRLERILVYLAGEQL